MGHLKASGTSTVSSRMSGTTKGGGQCTSALCSVSLRTLRTLRMLSECIIMYDVTNSSGEASKWMT